MAATEIIEAFGKVVAPGNVQLAADWATIENSNAARLRLSEWDKQEQGDERLEAMRRDLLPGLIIAERLFHEWPRQWRGIFNYMRSADGRFVYDIKNKDESLETAVSGDNADGIATSCAVLAVRVAERFVHAEEMRHASVLNNGGIYEESVGGDGKALFAEDHPSAGGLPYSNLLHLELNVTAIEKTATAIRLLRDEWGLPLSAKPRLLLVPIQLEFAAERIKQAGELDWLREGYRVLDFLEKPTAWYMMSTLGGLVHHAVAPFQLDLRVAGDHLELAATQSYGCGHTNPRACFASIPEPDA